MDLKNVSHVWRKNFITLKKVQEFNENVHKISKQFHEFEKKFQIWKIKNKSKKEKRKVKKKRKDKPNKIIPKETRKEKENRLEAPRNRLGRFWKLPEYLLNGPAHRESIRRVGVLQVVETPVNGA